MSEQKKFYWIKLRTNFFNRADIDFLLSQKNGAEYVVLYQMICLSTANNNGRLEDRIGEMLVPYNAEKIARDCKYFSIDTVNMAMLLYKKLGLIYEEDDGILRITDSCTLVGSESGSKEAERKRKYRNKQKEIGEKQDGTLLGTNCPTECRDKSLENRDIDNRYIEKEINKEKETKSSKQRTGKMTEGNFDAFWEAYPKKENKQKAKEKFLKLDDSLMDVIMSALAAQKTSEQWTKDKGKYIPLATSWLNGCRWEDELEIDLPKPETAKRYDYPDEW